MLKNSKRHSQEEEGDSKQKIRISDSDFLLKYKLYSEKNYLVSNTKSKETLI
jgi:hypothetical protein